jgi:hypothetical protein
MIETSMKRFVCVRVEPIHEWDTGGNKRKRGKGKTKGLAGMLAHDFRFVETPNADKILTKTNIVFSRKTKWKPLKATHENLQKIGIHNEYSIPLYAEELLRRLKVKVQKNSDVASALMLTVSPEFLRDGDLENEINQDKLDKYISGTIKFLRKRFGSRLLLACLHMDEMNPHISAYILPLLKKEMVKEGRSKSGEKKKPRAIRVERRLGHSELFTKDTIVIEKVGKQKVEVIKGIVAGTCSILQDEYADALKEEGLQVLRGVHAEPDLPRLKYVTAKEQYARMNRGIKDGEKKIKQIENLSREEIEELLRQCMALAVESENLKIQRDHYHLQAAAKDERISKLAGKVDDIVRDIPVAKVIEAITGFQPIPTKADASQVVRHKSNKEKFIDINCEFHFPNGQKIGVDIKRNAFQNLTPDIPFLGEGSQRNTATGSINAVIYLTGCSFDTAMARLHEIYGNDSLVRAVPKKLEHDVGDKKKVLLVPDESKWPELLAKLKALKIKDDVIDQAIREKTIAANREGQLLFTKQPWTGNDRGDAPGILIVDPQFPEVPVMETGKDDLFMLMDTEFIENDGYVGKIVKDTILCATPLDALAIKSQQEFRRTNVIAIGQNPGDATKNAIKYLAKEHPKRLHYADNLFDHGLQIATWLAEYFKGLITTIPLPAKCLSWVGLNRADMPEISQSMESDQPQGPT